MAKNSVKGAALAAAVASLVAVPMSGHRGAVATDGVTVAGNSCSGKNGCGSKPKDPNAPKKAPQAIG